MIDDQKFLTDIQSDNADMRFAAWRRAGEASPAVIPQLGELAESDKPGVAKAAREALTTMVHSVGKDPAAANRAAVARGLLALNSAHGLRLLSDIAGDDAVSAVARLFTDPKLREEAIYCIERIPGDTANKALIASYKAAPDDFKPRILAALGHRRVAEAAPLCAEAMRSSNKDIALAGVKAYGRIGKATPGADITVHMDSMLRFADAQRLEGNTEGAMKLYKIALDRPEEHIQCAAIIGLAKIRTSEAAVAIHPKLKSDNRKVRITAENAWKGMALQSG
jgi:hypothetical protein